MSRLTSLWDEDDPPARWVIDASESKYRSWTTWRGSTICTSSSEALS